VSRRRAPRTRSIRRWLALALLMLFLVPFLAMLVIGVIVFTPGNGPRGSIANEISTLVRNNAERWTEPAWQTELRQRSTGSVDVVLEIGDEEVFRTGEPFAENDTRTVIAVTILDTEPPQVAYLYMTPDTGPPEELQQWFIPVALFSALLFTLTGIAWFLRRAVVRPLESTSEAARRIARGELDISLPYSRVREVAELKSAFEAMSDELQTSLEHRAAMEGERRMFIAAIAHDLRTPLFALRGSLQGLAHGIAVSAEQRARYLTIALAKADQLERLIADLFTFSRTEYMGEIPEKEPVDLAVFLRGITEGISERVDERQIALLVDGSMTGPVIAADTHLLTRAIENVLDNALRHTPDGGVVRLAWQDEGASVAITITDTGPGFPEQDLPHVFEPLYRGDASRNRQTGGAGLGLAIARRIIVAHGGTITADNMESGGARITIALPKE
jgi:signal transduction histidine kinase